MMGTTWVKEKPESITRTHSGGGEPREGLNAIRDAAVVSSESGLTIATSEGRGLGRTWALCISAKVVLLKDHLVVLILHVRQVEDGLGQEESRQRWVELVLFARG